MKRNWPKVENPLKIQYKKRKRTCNDDWKWSILQELPEHQRSDAVSSMVYEANARVRDPVYGCVGAISSLQQQIDSLQTQLALAQAEVVHMKMRHFVSTSDLGTSSPQNLPPAAASSKFMPSQSKSFFCMDIVDQANMAESLWSY